MTEDPTNSSPPFDEAELASILADALRSRGWEVDQHPLIGLYRPDFVLRAPGGEQIVAELKDHAGNIHFGEISQAAAYRSGASAFSGMVATPVLFSTGTAPDELRNLAAELEVQLITARADNATDTAAQFADELDAIFGGKE